MAKPMSLTERLSSAAGYFQRLRITQNVGNGLEYWQARKSHAFRNRALLSVCAVPPTASAAPRTSSRLPPPYPLTFSLIRRGPLWLWPTWRTRCSDAP